MSKNLILKDLLKEDINEIEIFDIILINKFNKILIYKGLLHDSNIYSLISEYISLNGHKYFLIKNNIEYLDHYILNFNQISSIISKIGFQDKKLLGIKLYLSNIELLNFINKIFNIENYDNIMENLNKIQEDIKLKNEIYNFLIKKIFEKNEIKFDIKIDEELEQQIELLECLDINISKKKINVELRNTCLKLDNYELNLKENFTCEYFKEFENIEYIWKQNLNKKIVELNLEEFIYKINDFEINCENCKNDKFDITNTYENISEDLIIHFKRFKVIGDKITNFKFIKIDSEINYPLELDFNNNIYYLKGIICHIGKLNDGHYYTMINNENSFFKLNDEKISLAENLDKKVYMLYYSLKK